MALLFEPETFVEQLCTLIWKQKAARCQYGALSWCSRQCCALAVLDCDAWS